VTSINAVLFDLDGTLLDSAPDLIGSLNHVRSTENLPPLDVQEFRRFASHGAVGLLRAGMPETDGTTFEQWRLAFLDHYAQNSYNHSRLFDGVSELLEFLRDSGIPWGIVTNKLERLTLPIMAHARLDKLTSCVVCGDTLSRSKPDPAPVQLACKLINERPCHTLFVGDDIRDLEAGSSAGTQTAAVHYGYGTYEPENPLVSASFHAYHPLDLVQLLGHG
jgi:phosphoglycolate phosphatase